MLYAIKLNILYKNLIRYFIIIFKKNAMLDVIKLNALYLKIKYFI